MAKLSNISRAWWAYHKRWWAVWWDAVRAMDLMLSALASGIGVLYGFYRGWIKKEHFFEFLAVAVLGYLVLLVIIWGWRALFVSSIIHEGQDENIRYLESQLAEQKQIAIDKSARYLRRSGDIEELQKQLNSAHMAIEEKGKKIAARDFELSTLKQSPVVTIEIVGLYIQPVYECLFGFDGKQITDSDITAFLVSHGIPPDSAAASEKLFAGDEPVTLARFREEKLNVLINCDIFMQVKIDLKRPQSITFDEYLGYRLTATQYGNSVQTIWMSGLDGWRLITDNRIGHTIKQLPQTIRNDGPAEGWLHFLACRVLWHDVLSHTYRLTVSTGAWSQSAEIGGRNNLASKQARFERVSKLC